MSWADNDEGSAARGNPNWIFKTCSLPHGSAKT
jgi:hypothetical protein